MKYVVVDKRRLIYEDKDYYIYYFRGKIYVVASQKQYIVRIKSNVTISLLERMTRTEVKIGIRMGDIFYYSYHGGIYAFFLTGDDHRVRRVHNYRDGMNNPLSLVRIEDIKGFTDGLYYGEYWGNPDGGPVCIFCGNNRRWEKVFEFPADQITHIHGIVPDKQNVRLLILTGDADSGSGIWEARDNFKIVRPIIRGEQKYRCCVAFPYENGILYATDTPLEENKIYYYNEEKGTNNEITVIPGPCIYGRNYNDDEGKNHYLFATSVEPDSRIKGVRYLLTRKRGDGVKTSFATIWQGDPNEGFELAMKQKKDLFPMGLFQFGNFFFPNANRVYVIPQSVKKMNGKTIKLLFD